MSFVGDVLWGLAYLVVGIVDLVLGRRRRSYATSIFIQAPPDLVWSVLSARHVKFEGLVPVVVDVAPRAGDERVLEGTITVGDLAMPIAYRELSERPGEGAVIEVLKEGSDPRVAPGEAYFVAYALSASEGGTTVTFNHELTHSDFLGRIGVPVGARQSARRVRDHCEKLAGTAGRLAGGRLGPAVMTGLLTYASFFYLFGWRSAAVLLALIVVHEAGHALAMRWVGLPVHGIYFIPFFGGVAVAGAPHRSEAERGFVALMGPGLSLLTTAAFAFAWLSTGEPGYAELALLSAFLNGINLAPVLPLDGGQVVDSLLSAWDPEVAAVINFVGLIAGVAFAVMMGWHVLTVLLLLTAPFVLGRPPRRIARPMRQDARLWLATGYVSSAAFYAGVIFSMI